MSADLMLVSKTCNFGHNANECVIVDETSMGAPHTDFGIILMGAQSGLFGGIITEKLIDKVGKWFDQLEHKDYLNKEDILGFLKKHVDEPLEFECW